MDLTARPVRSVLYIPGSNERALEKARGLKADAIIFDLEDAVAVDQKAAARATLARELASGGYGARLKIVRINAFSTDWGKDDLAAFENAGADVILLPKAGGAGDIDALATRMAALPGYADTDIWAMIETPAGVLNAAEIAQASRVSGLVMGTNDLGNELGTIVRAGRAQLQAALQMSILAARLAGVLVIDGVYNAFRDVEGLGHELEQGRDLGFDGKTLIHPAQIEATNSVFAPSQDAIDLANRQIEAFEAAEAEGLGVVVVDGQIVENLHVATARRVLARSATIAAMEGA